MMAGESEYFDYTLATNWERFVALLEQRYRSWVITGFGDILRTAYSAQLRSRPSLVKVQALVKHRLPWRREPYVLQLHLPTAQLQQPRRSLASGPSLNANAAASSASAAGLELEDQFAAAASPDAPRRATAGNNVAAVAAAVTAPHRAESHKAAAAAALATAAAAAIATATAAARTTSQHQAMSRTTSQHHSSSGVRSPRAVASKGHSSRGGSMLSGAGSGGRWRDDPLASGEDLAGTEGDSSWCLDLDLDLDQLVQSLAQQADAGEQLEDDDGLVGWDIKEVEEEEAAEVIRAAMFSRGRQADSGHHTGSARTGSRVSADTTAAAAASAATTGFSGINSDGGEGSRGSSPEHGNASVVADGPKGVVVKSTSGGSVELMSFSPHVSGPLGRQFSSVKSRPGSGGFASRTSSHTGRAAGAAGGGGATSRRDADLANWWPQRLERQRWWCTGRQHKLQRWFGIDTFLMLSPKSYSGRLLDEAESSGLLSALLCALCNTGLPIPAFLPVHDALRDSIRGGAVLPAAPWGDESAAGRCPTGRRITFSADSVHVSNPPVALTTTRGQLIAFSEQLAPTAPQAAAACRMAADRTAAEQGAAGGSSPGGSTSIWAALVGPDSSSDWTVGGGAAGRADGTGSRQQHGSSNDGVTGTGHSGAGRGVCIDMTAVYSFLLPNHMKLKREDTASQASDDAEAIGWDGPYHDGGGWDAGASWQPWAAQRDPIQCCEVDLVWEDIPLTGRSRTCTSGGTAGTAPSDVATAGVSADYSQLLPSCVSHMVVHALTRGYCHSTGRGLGLTTFERTRQHIELQRSGADWLWSVEAGQLWQPPSAASAIFCPRASLDGTRPPSPREAYGVDGRQPGSCSFSMMLSALLCARAAAVGAAALGDLASADWWEEHGMVPPPVPPEGVLQDVLRDLFDDRHSVRDVSSSPSQQRPCDRRGPLLNCIIATNAVSAEATTLATNTPGAASNASQAAAAASPAAGAAPPTSAALGGSGSTTSPPPSFPRNAPAGGLLSRLALHCLVFGNARAIALLWQRFMREVRFSHWEYGNPLPRMNHTPAQPPPAAAAAAAAASAGLASPSTPFQSPSASSHPTPGGRLGGGASRAADASPRPGGTAGGTGRGETTAACATVELSCCLLYQKLQMLDVCIQRREALQSLKRHGVPPPAPPPRGTPRQSPTPAAAQQARQQQQQQQEGSEPSDKTETDMLTPEDDEEDGWDVPDAEWDEASSAGVLVDARAAAGRPSSFDGLTTRGSARADAEDAGFYSASEDEDFVRDQGPRGRVSYLPPPGLLRHPERAVAVPLVQPAPVYTEDRLLERSAALAGLSTLVNGSEVVQRLSSEALVSDMAAFKAANPGALLQDFLRWHSPADVVVTADSPQGKGGVALSSRMSPLATRPPTRQVSKSPAVSCNPPTDGSPSVSSRPPVPPGADVDVPPTARTTTPATEADASPEQGISSTGVVATRSQPAAAEPSDKAASAGPAGQEGQAGSTDAADMAASTNPWHVLWSSTSASPAWEQKPLQDPSLEAERTLHDLDTLPPVALFDTLFAVGLASAVTSLAASKGAALPPAAALVMQFHRLSSNVLKKACSLDSEDRDSYPGGASGWDDGSGTGWMRLVGLEPHAAEYLLGEFQFLEQVVVLGESLVGRLPGCEAIAAGLLAGATAAGEAVVKGDSRALVEVDDVAQRVALSRLMVPNRVPASTIRSSSADGFHIIDEASPSAARWNTTASPSLASELAEFDDDACWPQPVQREWAIFCGSSSTARSSSNGGTTASTGGGASVDRTAGMSGVIGGSSTQMGAAGSGTASGTRRGGCPDSRMFVSVGGGEMRVALTLVAED